MPRNFGSFGSWIIPQNAATVKGDSFTAQPLAVATFALGGIVNQSSQWDRCLQVSIRAPHRSAERPEPRHQAVPQELSLALSRGVSNRTLFALFKFQRTNQAPDSVAFAQRAKSSISARYLGFAEGMSQNQRLA